MINNFWHGKKVTVAGGTGFIGSHTVEMLVKLGARVRVPTSNPVHQAKFLDSLKKEVEIIETDLRDLSCARKIISGQEIVLNLAAVVGGIGYNIKHHATSLRENTLLSLIPLEVAREAAVERFLVVSSACVYPSIVSIPTGEEEGFDRQPDPANYGYGWSKRLAELLGKTYAQEYGMKIALARPYNAYGPRDNFEKEVSHVIPSLIRRILDGENPLTVWGDGTPTRSFIYVTDLVDGLLGCLEKYPVADVVNIGSEEEISIKDLVDKIIQIAGVEVEVKFDTSKPNGQPRRLADISKAKKVLGFRPKVTLDQGLANTISYYRESIKS